MELSLCVHASSSFDARFYLLHCCGFCSTLVIRSHLGCILALHKCLLFLRFKESENLLANKSCIFISLLWQCNPLNDFARTAVLRPRASVCSVCDAAIIDVTFRPIVYSS